MAKRKTEKLHDDLLEAEKSVTRLTEQQTKLLDQNADLKMQLVAQAEQQAKATAELKAQMVAQAAQSERTQSTLSSLESVLRDMRAERQQAPTAPAGSAGSGFDPSQLKGPANRAQALIGLDISAIATLPANSLAERDAQLRKFGQAVTLSARIAEGSSGLEKFNPAVSGYPAANLSLDKDRKALGLTPSDGSDEAKRAAEIAAALKKQEPESESDERPRKKARGGTPKARNRKDSNKGSSSSSSSSSARFSLADMLSLSAHFGGGGNLSREDNSPPPQQQQSDRRGGRGGWRSGRGGRGNRGGGRGGRGGGGGNGSALLPFCFNCNQAGHKTEQCTMQVGNG